MPKTPLSFYLHIIAVAVVIFAVGSFFQPKKEDSSGQAAVRAISTYDRVLKTKTLRCGYIPYSYFFKVDPNSGNKSGVMYDTVNELGRLLDLKVEWAEELTWATVVTAIDTGRVDAFCSGMWIDTRNGKFLNFSRPLFFNSIGVYGRADENRFQSIDQLNQPNVRVVSRDGGTSSIIQAQDFAKSTLVSLPSSISDGEIVAYIVTNKADVIFYGDDYLAQYMQENPGKIKPLFPDQKLRKYATAIGLPMADPAFTNMINNALIEMESARFVDRALLSHAPPGSWLPAVN
jgi:ABC-type amino acid transport substrate-binding protein